MNPCVFFVYLLCFDVRPLFGTSPVRIGSLKCKVARSPTLQTFPYLGRSVATGKSSEKIWWLVVTVVFSVHLCMSNYFISFLISTSLKTGFWPRFQQGKTNSFVFSRWIFQDDISRDDNRKLFCLDDISGRLSFRILIVLPAVVYHALSRNVETTLRHKGGAKNSEFNLERFPL